MEKIKEELSASGIAAGVEAENENIEIEPFNPEEISIDNKTLIIETVLRRLKQGTLRLAPEFQRNEVWSIRQKSQLIESMLLRIPLQMFYVSEDERGNWDVVDGLQRLSTIKNFVIGDTYFKTKNNSDLGDGFKLKELEFWKELEGNQCKSLPEKLYNRILETELNFTIINPGTPEEVKRNIFKRINTGGLPLTTQEIRHALYHGPSTTLLKKLVGSADFLKTTKSSVNDSRMAGRELILRMLAFLVRSYKHYPKSSDMDTFLSDTMIIINNMQNLNDARFQKKYGEAVETIRIRDVDMLEAMFTRGMIRGYGLFGKHAFRRSLPGSNRAPINKALFDSWGVSLARLTPAEYASLQENKKSMLFEYKTIMESDDRFIDSIGKGTWKHASVWIRFSIVKTIIKNAIGKQHDIVNSADKF